MYIVTINNNILHDPRIKDYQILNPVLNLEVNKTHSFNFTIYPNNPMFNSIERLKSIIEVYDDGELIFRGRPLNDTTDFNKATTIQCEGELAYLNDSTMEPYTYFGTVRGLLELYIENHNAQVDVSKQFTLGTVNVTGDFVRSNIDYTNTWEELSTKTFGSGMGGYLRLRRENDINYIDYLNDSPYISGQTIELSKNLLDYEKTVNASDIVTVLIPLGAKLKDEEGNELDERLTIESVNAGSKFIEHSSGISKYGRIVGYKVWDDINSPSLLKTRADNDLNFLVNLGISIKIKAIDLNILDKSIPKIRFFEYVKIISKPHEIDDSMLIKKQTIHLDDPSQNTIEVGVEVSSFTDKQLEANNTIKIIKSDYVTNEKMTNVITPITVQVSQIIQQADSIELSVNELRTDLENEIERVEVETNGRINVTNTAITTEVSERKTADGEILSETRSEITALTDNINLKVDKNGVISAINVSPELIKILSKNIALEGYTSINDHFKVLTNGDVQMVNADVSGKITAKTGQIGNFILDNGVQDYLTDVSNRDYTYSDMVIMKQILENQLTPNAYQKFTYDIDGNGVIDVVDMAMLEAHLRGTYQIEKPIKSRVRLGTADGRVETTVMYGTSFNKEGPSFIMQGERLRGTLIDADALSIDNHPVWHSGNRPIKYQHNVTVTNSTGEILMFSFINWSETPYTNMNLIASALYGTAHVNKENALTATGVIVRSSANRFISGVFTPNGTRLDYVYAESTGAISVSNTAGWKSVVINDYVQSI